MPMQAHICCRLRHVTPRPSPSNLHSLFLLLTGLRHALLAGAPLPRKILAAYGVPHSVSQAWRIGRAVARCRRDNDLKGIPRAILELQNGACLFIGKIVDVRRVR